MQNTAPIPLRIGISPRPGAKQLVGALVFASLLGCTRSPIVWEDPVDLPRDSVAVTDLHYVRAVDQLCGAAESALEAARFRAGWGRNGEGLMVLRSEDGGVAWDAPVIADSRPSIGSACSQVAIFVDTMNRYLHLSYFLAARGAGGLYYVHSMNADQLSAAGDGMFEAPRAIVYGDRAVLMSIASRGDTVAVVHEDPNSQRARIMLALSTTGGHSFDYREHVSPQGGGVVRPRVALRAGEIHVGWSHAADTTHAVRRIGRFR